MGKIIKKENLGKDVWRYHIEAPSIAKKRRAGQFVILRAVKDGERIPLTISAANSEAGWFEVIFKVVGETTQILAKLNVGDNILDIAGPLGRPTHIENFGDCICIGGGVGIAPLYPIVQALKLAGNNVTSIIGAKDKSSLILRKEIQAVSDRLFVVTDDGSSGDKCFTSDKLSELLRHQERFDYAMIIGPPRMMQVTSEIAMEAGILTYVSLNPIMLDGTGMCGGCRVNINNKTYFACVDGPEFNAAMVDWDSLVQRLNNYNNDLSPSYDCCLG